MQTLSLRLQFNVGKQLDISAMDSQRATDSIKINSAVSYG